MTTITTFPQPFHAGLNALANHRHAAHPIDQIPDELKQADRWVVARMPSKTPLRANAPTRNASVTDRSTWSSFDIAKTAVLEDPELRLGFVLGSGYVGVDLDHCRDADTGVVEAWAQEIVDRLRSYSEISVSGTGIHIICRGVLPVGARRKGGVEMYSGSRYFITTGDGNGQDVAERTPVLADLHHEVFGHRATTSTAAPERTSDDANDTAEESDSAVLQRIRASAQADKFNRLWTGDTAGHTSPSEADAALCAILGFWTDGNREQMDRLFRQSSLCRDKWRDRADYRDRTITHALAGMNRRWDAGKSPAEESGTSTLSAEDGDRKAPSKSHASRLVRLVKESSSELFHTPDGTPYVTTMNQTVPLNSEGFKTWLRRECYRTTDSTPSATALADAVGTLAGFAIYDGPTHDVFTRVAMVRDAVYLDLGDNAVEITPAGWHVVADYPVRFLRRPGFLPLPTPQRNDADLATLMRTFLNVHDDHDMRLIISWLVGALRGLKPFPVLSVSGEQGSAKSSACRFLRRLVDPNTADTRLSARDQRDLMIAARNSYVIAFENLTRLDDALTNGLCCIATGAGTATRALCTDADEIIISVARPILLNGINDVAKRPDLLDRCLQVVLDPIPDHARKTEREVDAAFESVQPLILGRLLDAVACALKHEPMTRPTGVPRMADLTITMTAAEPALGWETGASVALLRDSRAVAVEGLLDGNPVAAALPKLVLPWSGTATELQRLLTVGLTTADLEAFPKNPKAMGSALRELAPALRQTGIDVTFRKGHDRTIQIRRVAGSPEVE